jgi:hypothetical protein
MLTRRRFLAAAASRIALALAALAGLTVVARASRPEDDIVLKDGWILKRSDLG